MGVSRLLPGIGQAMRDIMFGEQGARDKRETVTTQGKWPGYPENQDIADRIKFLAHNYYREAAFEKIQFSRKWMRNALLFQGYQELEWVDGAWEAILREGDDFAYPNNYYRSHVMYGASLYVKNAPQFVFVPTNGDFESQAVSQACEASLDVIKENVNYDSLRVWEAIYLRLFGNSFRYSYYSLDPRHGMVRQPIFEQVKQTIDEGSYQCPACGYTGEGHPEFCENCGAALPADALTEPTTVEVPRPRGEVEYPRGKEVTEVVSPLEMYLRSSASNIAFAPYVVRVRPVDRIALQNDFPDMEIGGGVSEGGVIDPHGDLSLTYQQALADLPGDPAQFAAWYERATGYNRVAFIQAWIRPSQYRHDKELTDKYPDGIYAAIVGDKLLESKNESIDDHWVHLVYNPVPGRIWGDGDDDLIPKQLQLNETERLIMRNQAHASAPKLVIDSQRVDRNNVNNDPAELIEVKITGRPVSDAVTQLQGQQLPQEVWQWRDSQLRDMEYHSGVFGSAIGQHQPGVNTFGGQMEMAGRTEANLSPLLLLYKEANEQWARQVLKLAAQNWLDERVRAVQGINGNWEFQKLRGAALDLDKVKIIAKLIPIDYSQQQAMSAAVGAGLLDANDPRVQRKALELFQLPTELSAFNMDAKVQWKEIERMKQGEQVQPMLLRDNDAIHAEICRVWLNSDEAEQAPPEVVMAVYQHMTAHMTNGAKAATVTAAMQAAPMEVQQALTGQAQQTAEQQAPEQGEGEQAGQRGGQVPQNPGVRQARARKGRAAKPNTPQPPSGNQYQRGR